MSGPLSTAVTRINLSGIPQQPAAASAPASLKVNIGRATIDSVREHIHAAVLSLKDVFNTFRSSTRSVYTTSMSVGAPIAVHLDGIAARTADIAGGIVLQTTEAVNTQTDTDRWSSSPLGLDLASAFSSLTSSGSLALDLVTPESASTITSTGEMNTATTSYGSETLTFTGSGGNSTSAATLTGTYTGVGAAAAATSLRVKIKTDAPLVNGLTSSTIKFEVADQTGQSLFTFNGALRAGQQVYLGDDIGLSISFSSGSLVNNNTAATTVSHAPVEVDASASFNNANTKLRPRFDGNAQVAAGSFTINGTTIAVNAADSINTVVSRINGSAAGVVASLQGDKLTLTTAAASEDAISLGNDSSGFLSAVKLAAATTARGNIRDDRQVLAKTSQFASVQSGSFTVNGVTIAVDRNTDTLASLVTRINGAGAGVIASLDATENKLVLRSSASSEDAITVGSDTTGFVAAAKLTSANTVRGNIADNVQALATTPRFAAVHDGSFDINGISIAVNAAHDSLDTVLQRINNAGAGVLARYDQATDRLLFAADTPGGALVLDRDSSGFLAAAAIASGAAGSHVNADAAFDGSGVGSAFLDPGLSVHSGGFTVNGVVITVSDDDTIRGVLQKISTSAAGVDAAYDDDTQRITLAARTGTTAIALAGDTSGFLAAVKLDASTTTTTSQLSPFDKPLAEIGEYAAVRSGTVTVNGQAIELDPSTMSLRDVVAALNDLTEVSASLDESSGRVAITGRRAASPVTISDASRLLDTLGIAAGSYMPGVTLPALVRTETGKVTTSNAVQTAASADSALDDLNAALSQLAGAATAAGGGHFGDGFGGDLGDDIVDALHAALDGLREAGIGGLSVSGDGTAARLTLDREAFVTSLSAPGMHAGTAVDALLDRADSQLAAVATAAAQRSDEHVAPAAAHSMPSGFEIANRIRSQLAALLAGADNPAPRANEFSPPRRSAAAAAYSRAAFADDERNTF